MAGCWIRGSVAVAVVVADLVSRWFRSLPAERRGAARAATWVVSLALLFGVRPAEVHAWYLAVYVDAVEWVELPNTLGMSQFADGGLMASKPYVATGKYIQRMSNYCSGCRFDPAQSTGPKACPFTTLYWNFLIEHEALLAKNPRTVMQVKNLARVDASTRAAIQAPGGMKPSAKSASNKATRLPSLLRKTRRKNRRNWKSD